MDNPSLPLKQRSCFKCGFREETVETVCPKCGRRLQTSISIRLRGILLIFCGVFLMAIMGYVSLSMLDAINLTTPAHGGFNGTREQMVMIFGICGLVITFGFVSFITGLWQTIIGRRNKLLVWAGAAFGIALFLAGIIIFWRF
ncbi:MAG: hypothetical protein ABIO36_10455 [Pyrinomonadaceae bacterium]